MKVKVKFNYNKEKLLYSRKKVSRKVKTTIRTTLLDF